MENKKMNTYKFSKSATSECPDILRGKTPEQFIRGKFEEEGWVFGLDGLLRNGTYKLSGWFFDFRPHMKRFLVKQYGEWNEYFSLNKTLLRKAIYGRIEQIVEIK